MFLEFHFEFRLFLALTMIPSICIKYVMCLCRSATDNLKDLPLSFPILAMIWLAKLVRIPNSLHAIARAVGGA